MSKPKRFPSIVVGSQKVLEVICYFICKPRRCGGSMYTSSNRSPWKKIFFTLICLNGESRLVIRESMTLTVFILAIGEMIF